MAGFRFKLEVVRRLRKQAQDTQRRAVAGAIRSVVRVEDRIARLGREVQSTLDGRREAQGVAHVDMACLRGHELYRGWLSYKTREARAELARCQASVNEERDKLATATKELKVIEKLRERQKARYDTWIRRQEQSASDEAALQTYLRDRGQSSTKVRIS
ncbi:MAG: flagellar export protein FliJ [Phycisphaerales bacterium]|nr:MAG: flagellar export protein FliJ [Phycisphaerales bacterium]